RAPERPRRQELASRQLPSVDCDVGPYSRDAARASLRYSGRMTVGPTPSPTVRHLLRDDLRGMYPGYFALVMATGILSNAFFYLSHDALSDALYVVALVAFPALV